MGCLFGIFAGLFPRLGVLLIWLVRQVPFTAAFGGSGLLPLLGVLFLPFTTLLYVLLWTPAGLPPLGWLWLVLAVLIDLGSLGSSGDAGRDRFVRPRA